MLVSKNNQPLLEADVYQQRIDRFVEILPTVETLRIQQGVNLALDNPAEDAAKQFIAKHGADDPTLFLHDNIADYLEGQIVGFEPLVSSGQKASRNGVFFGSFVLADGSEVSVAVKPHESVDEEVMSKRAAESACLRDYFVNVSAQEAKLDTIKPVGFLLDREGTQYSFSLLEEDLTTLDSAVWTNYFSEVEKNQGMQEQWGKVASVTAHVHSKGESLHGDLAPRNIATNPHGQVFLIDWEFGNITEKPSNDVEDRFGNTWIDIKSLMLSMVRPSTMRDNPGIGMFENCKGSWWEGFKDVFFDDYAYWRLNFANEGSHRAMQVAQVKDEIAQLEVTLREQMDQWQNQYVNYLGQLATNS